MMQREVPRVYELKISDVTTGNELVKLQFLSSVAGLGEVLTDLLALAKKDGAAITVVGAEGLG
jgi:hypothetical protein